MKRLLKYFLSCRNGFLQPSILYVYVAEFQLNRYIAADLICCHQLLNLLERVCDDCKVLQPTKY